MRPAKSTGPKWCDQFLRFVEAMLVRIPPPDCVAYDRLICSLSASLKLVPYVIPRYPLFQIDFHLIPVSSFAGLVSHKVSGIEKSSMQIRETFSQLDWI